MSWIATRMGGRPYTCATPHRILLGQARGRGTFSVTKVSGGPSRAGIEDAMYRENACTLVVLGKNFADNVLSE